MRKPVIPRDPIAMDPRIFREAAMDLRNDMLTIPLDQRFTLDEQQNLFFVNLERFALRGRADIDAIARAVEARLGGLNRRVYAIVNYDGFTIVPELVDALPKELLLRVRCRLAAEDRLIHAGLGSALIGSSSTSTRYCAVSP